jgi:proteasome-associated ATPase
MPTDKELLKEAMAVIEEQNQQLAEISESALELGIVVSHIDQKTLIKMNNGMSAVIPKTKHPVGTGIAVHPMTKQVVDTVALPKIGKTQRIFDVEGDFAEIMNEDGQSTFIVKGTSCKKIEKDDIVLLDSTGTVALSVVKKAPPKHIPQIKEVSWDDIGGNAEAKQVLREAIELPFQQPKVFAHYNKKPTSGILLSGPPGCGKTLLAQAAATSCGSAGGFLSVKGPEILDPYVGVAERNVRNLFEQAKAFKATSGKPAVVFIDEAEAILGTRGTHHAHMEKTIVPAFLAEMNGLEASSAIVILATNREDQLDSAVIRDGRIDFKVKVDRPDASAAKEILRIHLTGKPLAKGVTWSSLADLCVANLYTSEYSWLPYSGALLAAVVEKAATSAIRRDLRDNTLTGVNDSDFIWAIATTINQENSIKVKHVTKEEKVWTAGSGDAEWVHG